MVASECTGGGGRPMTLKLKNARRHFVCQKASGSDQPLLRKRMPFSTWPQMARTGALWARNIHNYMRSKKHTNAVGLQSRATRLDRFCVTARSTQQALLAACSDCAGPEATIEKPSSSSQQALLAACAFRKMREVRIKKAAPRNLTNK